MSNQVAIPIQLPPVTPTDPSPGTLPAVGTNTAPMLRPILILPLVGVALIRLSRRRNHTASRDHQHHGHSQFNATPATLKRFDT